MKKKAFIAAGLVIVVLLVLAAVFNSAEPKGTPAWQEVKHKIMPQFMPAEKKNQTDVVNIPFSPAVDIGVVRDEPDRYVFASSKELAAWGLTKEELFEHAFKNLNESSEEIELELFQSGEGENGKYIVLEATDGYAATRLLAQNIRARVAEQLGEEYIAGIPTRDFLIFWRQDFPFTKKFAEQVTAEFNAEQEYRLSPDLFLVKPEGIQPVKVEQPQL